MSNDRPNVVIAFADQMRAQATGYAGDPNVQTPHLDRLAAESIRFTCAVLAGTSAGRPIVVPSREPDIRRLPDPAPGSAAANRPGFRARLYASLPTCITLGWRPIRNVPRDSLLP